MSLKSVIITLLIIPFTATVSAKKRPNYPRAEIKVGYTYHTTYVRGSAGIVEKDIPFVLLANKEQSKFYSPYTENQDSLQSTPSGLNLWRKTFDENFKKSRDTGDRSFMDNIVYKTHLYVFRSTADGETRVYDTIGPLSYGCYSEPNDKIEWSIGDSIKSILGYDCTIATAEYHGRQWTAWFTPEIPLQEGPWKLHGLPGLIMEASESSGQHWFAATGIEASNLEMVPVYPTKFKTYEKMSRIDMLKAQRNGSEHSSSLASAEIGINLGTDHIMSDEEAKIDLLETDYH